MKQSGFLTWVYSILLIVGGVLGHAQTSRESVLWGLGAGLIMNFLSMGILLGKQIARKFAIIVTALLIAFFSYRLWLTESFFPPGSLALVSAVLFYDLYRNAKPSRGPH